MSDKKIKIRVSMPWIAYPGSTVQQNYAEDLTHGYLHWKIDNRESYDVKFSKLPNPKPFVTIDWAGNVKKTYNLASKFPKGSRFRIRSIVHIAQQEIHELTTSLKHSMSATEVTFKIDQQVNRDVISAGAQILARSDLRNSDVLLKLVKGFHPNTKYSDEIWSRVGERIKYYLSSATHNETIVRNTKWHIRELKFDNLYSYGEGNVINFDKLNGIVGIFGVNRAGKSSIVGSMMYSLFNTTDRGSMKNLYVCNIRKPFCYSKAIINVSGIDYVLERQTTKHENKRGLVHAATALNVFKINDAGEAEDLVGEQRTDTEKVIRSLIGTHEDFMMTSLSAQGEVNQFIQQGSTRRRQLLSRFLDLDIFDRMYDFASKDVNVVKSQLRLFSEKDWNAITESLKIQLDDLAKKLDNSSSKLSESVDRLAELKASLAKHSDFTPVSKSQVETQRNRVITLKKQYDQHQEQIVVLKSDIEKISNKIQTIESLRAEHNLDEMKDKLKTFNELENTVNAYLHSFDKEETVLSQQQRSLKILDEVPCDDKFPNCKFIKDAHIAKSKIDDQRAQLASIKEKLDIASNTLSDLRKDDLRNKVTKIEKLIELDSKLKIEISNKKIELYKQESGSETTHGLLNASQDKLDDLEKALKNTENAEVVSLRSQIDELSSVISGLDRDKLQFASERGRVISNAEKLLEEKSSREALLQEMKIYELISSAFSRKGIPNSIVTSQLPLINAEIAKILTGIVDFSVELEVDEESDSMDVYINYGDSKRLIELASGMEKMISSIAIRVALINISTLPKTNMFIIDEGFGALDDSMVESCNRLLVSLKKYFKTVIVITHVDGVKDSADTILEITKNENDARIVYGLYMNWRPYLNDRKIADHPDGFCIVVPADAEQAVPMFCDVCHYLMRSADDETAWREFECCHLCSLSWAASRKEAWKSGWRPDPEKLAYEISCRPPLTVNLELD